MSFIRGVRRTPRIRDAGNAARSARLPLLACVVVVAALLTTRAVAYRPAPASRAAEASQAFTRTTVRNGSAPVDTGNTQMGLVVVAQRADCEGNLAFAGLIQRRRFRSRTVVRQVLIEGVAADTLGLRQRLPLALRHAPIALLQQREREALITMGHRATPVFLIVDEHDRIVAAIPIDPDASHRIAHLRAIEHLVLHDPRS